ncbi:MAG: tetratricopeptide repeat protein [Acidobacteria bacterium]|nr:tetratricopeptide repeat protein [Acidobacteriota bacterium]
MDRILLSEGFAKAEKLGKFLRLVVENSLQEVPEQLKEYAIGVQVYGRREDFDPRLDSTVRAEAVRLRSRLAQYYGGLGKTDRIRIEIQKGAYAAGFKINDTPGAKSTVHSRWALAAVALLAIIVTGVIWSGSSRNVSAIDSLAVLQFSSLNSGKEMEAKAKEVRDEMIAELSKERGIRVSGSEARVSGAGGPEDWAKLGKQLKVGAFLEGSVHRNKASVRLTVKLISAHDGFHLWAGTFERSGATEADFENVAVHAAVESVLKALGKVELRGERSGTKSRSPEAVRLYLEALRGRSIANDHPREQGIADQKRRVQMLERCLEEDSAFASAWGALATARLGLADFREANWKDELDKAKAAANRALQLDEAQEEANSTLGTIELFQDLKLQQAALHLRRAVELSPHNGRWQELYGSALSILGRFDEAIDELSRAQIGDPDEARINIAKSNVYFNGQNFSKAEEEARAAILQANPGAQPKAHWALGIALEGQGKVAAAESELRKALKLDPRESRAIVALTLLLVRTGRSAKAEKLFLQGENMWKDWGGLGHTSRAYYRVAKGEKTIAIEELWKGYEAREGSFPYFLVDARLASIRSDPRVQELILKLRGPR